MAFLHGVEVVEIAAGARPIRSIDTGVIGLVGTAVTGAVNIPVLIAGSKREAVAAFGPVRGRDGSHPTIPAALDGVLDQAGPPVVVVNCLDPRNDRHVQVVDPVAQAADDDLPWAIARPDETIVVQGGIGGDGVALLAEGAGADYEVDLATGVVTRRGGTIQNDDRLVAMWTAADTVHRSAMLAPPAAGASIDLVAPRAAVTDVRIWRIPAELTIYEIETDWTYDAGAQRLVRVAGGAIPADGSPVWIAATAFRLRGVTSTDVVGGVAPGGGYIGGHALLAARERTGRQPRVLIAPRLSATTVEAGGKITGAPVMAGLIALADRMRAIAVIDGPDTDDVGAQQMRGLSGSRRAYLVDPWVVVGEERTAEPPSARVAGVIARSDAERGYWWSPSNREIAGIGGTTRPIDYTPGDVASRANLLNEAQISTIIRPDAGGFRLWGNRTLSSDPRWAYLSIVRTSDAIQERILIAHQWAVDRALTATYIDEVLSGISAFLRELQGLGAIVGGRAWVDPGLNGQEQIAAGKVTFSLDFTPPSPAERVTFQAILTDAYLADIV